MKFLSTCCNPLNDKFFKIGIVKLCNIKKYIYLCTRV